MIFGYVFSRESVIVAEGQTPEEPDGMYHNLLCIHLLVRLSKVKNITITKTLQLQNYNYKTLQLQKHYNYKNIEERYSVQPFTVYILSSSSSNYFI